jgi:predicted HicB family RNase H-like nuclease
MGEARSGGKERGRGRPAKLPTYQPFVLRLPPDLHRALSTAARRHGISLNDLLIHIAHSWLNEQPADTPLPASNAGDDRQD